MVGSSDLDRSGVEATSDVNFSDNIAEGVEESSESSSSSSEGSESDDDIYGVISPVQPPVALWKENCVVYQHGKSKALHRLPIGDDLGSFLCGRKVTEGCKVHSSAITSEAWKCKQCDAGRPIRSMETAVTALDRALKRHKR